VSLTVKMVYLSEKTLAWAAFSFPIAFFTRLLFASVLATLRCSIYSLGALMERPSKGSPRGKKAAAKKRAVKAARPRKVAKRKAVAKKKVVAAEEVSFVASASSEVLGCCTIKPPGEADFHIPHLTKKDCCERARALGAVCHWRPGECA
jgi:hypothetical protein